MKTAPLGDIAQIISGATPKTGDDQFWGGEILWATPADLSKLDGPYISSTPRTITEAGLKSCAAQVLPVGSVLLSSRAPIGHVAINTEPMATNQGFKSLIPRSGVVDAKYLYHWLRANTDYLQSLGNGATFKEVSKAVVSKVEVPLPPIDEQRRIAAILDKADGIRMKHLHAADQYSNLLTAQWTRTFAAGCWADVALGEVATFIRGVTYKPGDVVESKAAGTVGVLRTKNVQRQLVLDDVVYVPRTLIRRDDQIVRDGDILVSSANSWSLVGKCCWVPHLTESYAIGGFITALRTTSTDVDARFVYRWFSSSRVQASVRNTANQTTNIANLNLKRCEELRFPLPALDEQHRMVDLLDQSDNLRRKHLAAAEHTSGLLSSLSEIAFAGRL